MPSAFAYYNEFDPFAAAWLTALIADGLIPDGAVDTRSITDVEPADLDGFTQHHFFAGIGGWTWALRLAGWPDDRPVWTGSCPCQPFSNAGGRAGDKDDRHLWPHFYRLIAECHPARVFGEQVSSPLGRQWLASVRADMEALGYAVGCADLCAASVGAPHNRSRLWFGAVSAEEISSNRSQSLADDDEDGRELERETRVHGGRGEQAGDDVARRGEAGDMANTQRDHQRSRTAVESRQRDEAEGRPAHAVSTGRRGSTRSAMGDTRVNGTGQHSGKLHGDEAQHEERRTYSDHPPLTPSAAGSYAQWWTDCEWLPCRDGVYRPVEPRTFPLAAGVPGRVGLLRGYGNSIVPAVAQAWVEAFEETVQALKR